MATPFRESTKEQRSGDSSMYNFINQRNVEYLLQNMWRLRSKSISVSGTSEDLAIVKL
jgi:hypothetical protein